MKRLLGAVVAAFLLTGCQSADDPVWQRYHQALSEALDTPAIEQRAPGNIGAFPERRERLITVPEMRESMLNVYALRECDITSLVAARNNQLGRVAPPSQHWLYERTLWQRLERCQRGEVGKSLADSDRERLDTLTQLKTTQLPAVGFNALFESEEWEKNFARASQPLELAALPDITRELEALYYLETMVDNTYSLDWQADSATLENHLKTLQSRPLTAEILRTLLLAATRLDEANRLLALDSPEAVCLPRWPDELAPLSSMARRWLTAVNALFQAHDVTPPVAVAEYQSRWLSLDDPNTPWSRYQVALAEHLALRMAYPACEASAGVD
ncbi:DUF3080 family protein [Halomonas sp. HNIBRBA4712]|uniref:DUF3080 family protein n=1 Tax=Halomonas sp. HNIBRBA4712 TaxID=3373087 RepID=UPI0037462499